MFGIDVSKWNGIIDWSKVSKTKQFAILKATQKNNRLEESFERNYKGATENGLLVGVYRYVYAKTVAEAKKEAQAIVSILAGRKLSCGIWLDMEDSSIKKLGKTTLGAIIATESEIYEKAGYKVGIYCNKDWYYNVLDSTSLKTKYPFWIARYPLIDTGNYNEKSSLNPNTYAQIWQYSSKGKVDGISGNVDLNVLFDDNLNIFVARAANPTLKKGMKGNEVKVLQENLNQVVSAKLSVDGSFGPATENAVRKWQAAAGLSADGIYGPASYKKMKELLS